MSDLEALATIAHDAGIPLIVDNTLATPFLCRPIDWGADLVVHSTTKFMAGSGTSVGACVVDSGRFDWGQNQRFAGLTEPEPAYHGISFYETFGDLAFTNHAHAVGLRDLGPTMAPMNAWLTLLGTETLALRMERHCDNALTVARFLQGHPAVSWVSSPGLPDSPYHDLANKYLSGRYGSLFAFGVTGGYEMGMRVVESCELWSHLANIGDTRSLILHPASTTHRQLTAEQRTASGAGDDTVPPLGRAGNGRRPHRRPGPGPQPGTRGKPKRRRVGRLRTETLAAPQCAALDVGVVVQEGFQVLDRDAPIAAELDRPQLLVIDHRPHGAFLDLQQVSHLVDREQRLPQHSSRPPTQCPSRCGPGSPERRHAPRAGAAAPFCLYSSFSPFVEVCFFSIYLNTHLGMGLAVFLSATVERGVGMTRVAATASQALAAFMKHEAAGGILLFAAAILAIGLDNSPLAWLYDSLLNTQASIQIGPLEITKPLLLWINDGLMAVFFFLVGLEIKREVLQGQLSTRQQIALPGVAAIGGMAIPALIYVAFNYDNPETLDGWAIPAATDIAFALGVLALLGPRVPLGLKVFLLAVAIIDDLGAIIIIALFYTANLSVESLAISAFGLAALVVLNRLGVTRLAPYILIGIFVWVCVLKSGVHATLAGVVLAMAIPLRGNEAAEDCPLRRLEHSLHPWVAFAILPIFAFANAGVPILGLSFADLLEPLPLGIAAGLFIGKQIGVFGATWLSVKAGIAKMPEGVTWLQIYGVSLLTGIGFTMSLFIGTLAFPDPSQASGVRLGVICGSVLSATLGYLMIRWCLSRHAAGPQPKSADAPETA